VKDDIPVFLEVDDGVIIWCHGMEDGSINSDWLLVVEYYLNLLQKIYPKDKITLLTCYSSKTKAVNKSVSEFIRIETLGIVRTTWKYEDSVMNINILSNSDPMLEGW